MCACVQWCVKRCVKRCVAFKVDKLSCLAFQCVTVNIVQLSSVQSISIKKNIMMHTLNA